MSQIIAVPTMPVVASSSRSATQTSGSTSSASSSSSGSLEDFMAVLAQALDAVLGDETSGSEAEASDEDEADADPTELAMPLTAILMADEPVLTVDDLGVSLTDAPAEASAHLAAAPDSVLDDANAHVEPVPSADAELAAAASTSTEELAGSGGPAADQSPQAAPLVSSLGGETSDPAAGSQTPPAEPAVSAAAAEAAPGPDLASAATASSADTASSAETSIETALADDAEPEAQSLRPATQPTIATAAVDDTALRSVTARAAAVESSAPASTPAGLADASLLEGDDPWQQLATVIRPLRQLPDGSHRLSLQLRPAELGAVHLEVAVEDGQLSVRAVAENIASRDVLAAAMPDLRAELLRSGIDVGALDVGEHTSDGAASGGDNADQANGETPGAAGRGSHGPTPPAATSSEPTPSAPTSVRPDGRLDLTL